MTELLASGGGVARGEEALDVGPDEDRRDPAIALAQLGQQQRLPELLVRGSATRADEPILDRDPLEALPVANARAVQEGRRQADLAPEADEGEAQELEAGADGVELLVDVEARQGSCPAQVIAETHVAEEADQMRVGGQDAMIEAIPDEWPVVVVRGQPADLTVTLEHGDGVPPVGEPIGERHSREAAADDGDSHGVGGSPRAGAGAWRGGLGVPGRGGGRTPPPPPRPLSP